MKRCAFKTLVRAGLVTGCALLAACGSAAPPGADLGASMSDLSSSNGLTTNGLTTNGLTTNGLTTNGLTTNGLQTLEFQTWFAADTAASSTFMRYLVRCALAQGSSLTATVGATTYVWDGVLGFAPGWTAGGAMPLAEQQLVSACIAAHVNKYGQHVTISLRGYYADGQPIAVDVAEQADFADDEGCFFGNLFDGTGVFSAYSSDSPLMSTLKSSLRACAANAGAPGSCAPMVATGFSAQELCRGDDLQSTKGVFEYRTCTLKGVDYRPVCSRLTNSEISTCGDGVCQSTESCFDAISGSGCLADCGACL